MAVKKHILSAALVALASINMAVVALPGGDPFPSLARPPTSTDTATLGSVLVSRSITWPSTPPSDPTPTPTSTPADLLKPVILGCHGAFPFHRAEFNPYLITKDHTCIRDALATLANYQEFCEAEGVSAETKRKHCGNGMTEWPPSIERCCGIWTDRPIPEKYKDTPIIDITVGFAKVLSLDMNDFQTKDILCERYRPENQDQFAYYMQNLEKYGLQDLEPTNMMSFALELGNGTAPTEG